jgi:hypothetical protein
MRYSAVFVVGFALLGVGFLTGLFYSMVTLPASSMVAPSDERLDILVLKKIGHLDAEMQAYRVELQEAIRSTHDSSAQLNRPSSSDGRPCPDGDNGASRASPPSTRDVGVATRSDVSVSRLRDLANWKGDAGLRDKWTARTATEFKNWFGIPDQMTFAADGAKWIYVVRDEKLRTRYAVSVQNDRVHSIDVSVSQL